MKQATRFVVNSNWRLLVVDMGYSPEEVLKRAALPTDLFGRKEATLSVEEYFSLWHALERVVGAESLPLAIGQALSVESFDPPIFAAMCSPDLNTAVKRLQHFKRLVGPLFLALDFATHHTAVTIGCYQTSARLPRSLGLCELVFFTKIARLGTRHRVVPSKLVCADEVPDSEELRAYFGRSIVRGDVNQICFSTEDARRPFLTENAGMWSFFEANLQQRLADLDATATMVQRVKSALLEMLPGGQNSIEDAAGRLAMSKRTLQRHLKSEGANFQLVLNSTREELAQHYLANSRIPMGEISFLLGFQDTNSFVRAFKGWTGRTPGQARLLHSA